MKEFIFDRLVNRENICGLENEQKQIKKFIDQGQNIVIYAQRNYGKTSLIKNVIMEDFREENKKSFLFFVDLMGVKDMESIISRLKQGLEQSIKESFPLKSLANSLGEFFASLNPVISYDAGTGIPSVRIESGGAIRKKITIEDIFQNLDLISKKIPTLIILDEFQDIALIEEAESLFRNAFQQLKAAPIIILGSKKHLLRNIFALPNSPLAGFGKDVVIEPIDYEKYHDYISERFAKKKLKISPEDSQYLQDLMNRQPEAINVLCYEILQENQSIKIDRKIISSALQQVLVGRKRFETMLANFSVSEERILIEMAKENKVSQPQGKDFTAKVKLTARSVKTNIDRLMDQGIIDLEGGEYYICDPLLGVYLKYFR